MALSKDDKQKIVLAVVWGVFGLYAYAQFLVGPQLSKLKEHSLELARLNKQIQEVDDKDPKRMLLARQMSELQKAWTEVEAGFIREGDDLNVLKRFSSIAEMRHVQIVSVEELKEPPSNVSKEDAPPQAYQESFIRFELRCGYHELGAFINDIERMTPAYGVVGLDIQQDAADAFSHEVRLLIRGFTLVNHG